VLGFSMEVLHERSIHVAKHDNSRVCTVPTLKSAYTLLFRLFD
jgi:hypothetical protein